MHLKYSGPSHIRPPLGNRKYGHMREVAADEVYIMEKIQDFNLQNCGCMRRMASDESVCIIHRANNGPYACTFTTTYLDVYITFEGFD